MKHEEIELPSDKKIYFASDFHLGVPNPKSSLERERKIIRWLDHIKKDAHSIYLLGDIFDFWFEYKHAIPKGFIRLQGKLAELRDGGLPIYFFTGNHDMWMFDYFPNELGIPVYREPIVLTVGNQKLLIGHGDGLGPGDVSYKILKKIFNSSLCQWLFARLHPNLGIGIARYWSRNSRISNLKKEEKFNGEDNEYLLSYCRGLEEHNHHDFYVFGHRHLPLDIKVAAHSTYVNLGEWVHHNTYGVYDGNSVELKTFEG
ncbi:MAG TPA: UDP-2,3-diacylglucosamine diphosphatase [Cyclobacteriaceae bacterium]|nr:UDP-2,3-diacylglucosamine diphosphatase [Cyclobacteriaceae bacterium]MCB9239442.1 UDP-2,3-diacylglucosamine diphosphatase [Flammeovirgaceae bacterium]MCB0499631.1 UDP-2,3-diacylglucosamine diphosphatase [Cyclobacteriaceae bacterium]MCO5271175.1 UDP-2,3-diacylglucosamine diphosphatase [Cyclobacteriaceae bacterium]MCW5902619.1 UDP-2,3-diacylglucosamine diphosphatase [Cyclobacteriaceae bacterium]